MATYSQEVAATARYSSTSSAEEDNQANDETANVAPVDGNMRVVATHYNELKETGRRERFQSRIFHMRNFNNWIKSQLISEYLDRIKSQQRVIGKPVTVLDIGCGKGGDLLKWEKANISHLICTDLAEVSIEQCKRRYDEMCARLARSKYAKPFTAEFLACDSTLVRLRERYADPSLKLHMVSCQFAFHYSFESLSQAECMVRNAAECLAEDGYFIATMPNANEILYRLRASQNKRQFGNDIYNVEFVCETEPPPLFGAKYQFHLDGVVDCPEFLVYFPLLVKLCRKYGLKLDRVTPFSDYYKENCEKGRMLMERMKALESVQPNRIENNAEYAHVKRLVKGGNMGKAYGTLTQSEWEAISLYLVFAFKKGRTKWDAQGKPVYEFS